MREYYVVPGVGFVPVMGKCGSCSIAAAIAEAHHPELWARVDPASGSVHYPEGEGRLSSKIAKDLLPRTGEPDGDLYLLARDPVERFLSAMAQEGRSDVGTTLRELHSGALDDSHHFAAQASFLRPGLRARAFQMPRDVDAFSAALGLGRLPRVRISANPKPPITYAQIYSVTRHYLADANLFNSAG